MLISPGAKAFECYLCHGYVLSSCLSASGETYDFVAACPNFLFVCNPCKAEAAPAGHQLKKIQATVDPKVVCPKNVSTPADSATASDPADANWTLVTSKKGKSYASVTAQDAPLSQNLAHNVVRLMEEKDRADKEKRTIVAEHVPISDSEDDMRRAVAICSAIHPNISPSGLFRERLPPPPPGTKSAEKSVKHPILKIFLRSEEEKKLAMSFKSNLKNASLSEWMQAVYIRPSLSLATRTLCDELFQIASARNGQWPG